MSSRFIHRNWRSIRRQLNIAEAADEKSVAFIISDIITHNPGILYTSDPEQLPNPEVGLLGHQSEAVRSHHKAILRGESPQGDCDDFTETGAQLMFMAGIDARRILKIIVADENQFLYRDFNESKLRVSHIVAGYFDGALPETDNVADMVARDPAAFMSVTWLCDTWEQARPREMRHPVIMREDGNFNRHLPVAVTSLATGLTEYAVKGGEPILRRGGYLRGDRPFVRDNMAFVAAPLPLRNMPENKPAIIQPL